MRTSPAHITYAVAACLTTLLLASPVAAFAATMEDDKTPLNLGEVAEPTRQAATPGGGGGGGIVRMVVGLAIVLGVIYGLSWVLKQVKASKEGDATGAGLAPISSLPLGPNRSVHLVRVGTDLVLLGAAEKGVTPIRTYREDEARAAGLIPDDDDFGTPAPSGSSSPFGGAVKQLPAPGTLVETLRQRTVRR